MAAVCFRRRLMDEAVDAGAGRRVARGLQLVGLGEQLGGGLGGDEGVTVLCARCLCCPCICGGSERPMQPLEPRPDDLAVHVIEVDGQNFVLTWDRATSDRYSGRTPHPSLQAPDQDDVSRPALSVVTDEGCSSSGTSGRHADLRRSGGLC